MSLLQRVERAQQAAETPSAGALVPVVPPTPPAPPTHLRNPAREELMRDVWQTTFWTSAKTIDVHLGWVRKKLGDDTRRPTLITTIRGRGLRFEVTPPVYANLPPSRARA